MFTTRDRSPHLVDEAKTVHLKNPSNWTLTGYSRGGERTSFTLNEMKILFDAGMANRKSYDGIFLTHTHVDHCWGLPNLFGGKVTSGNAVPVFFPKESLQNLTNLMLVACNLSYPNAKVTGEEAWKQNGLAPFPITAKDKFSFKKLEIEVLKAVHTVSAVGYGLSSKKTKLVEEFKSLTQNEIIALKNSGVQVSETVVVPELAFFCDSTIHNLTNYQEWKKYPTVVVECTGFAETHKKEQTRQRGHTHFEELFPVMENHKDKHWVLIHTSLKCNDSLFADKENDLRSMGLDVTFVV